MLFPGLRKGPMNRFLTRYFRESMRKRIADPQMEAKVLPDYLIGCKRILISEDYLPVLQQEHVQLVTGEVKQVKEHSLVCNGEEYTADVIIYGTGFKSSQFLFPMAIRGLSGALLHQVWGNRPHAWWGLTVPQFPNFFMTYGPSTNLAHNSIIFMIECQVEYIVKAVHSAQQRKLRAIHLKEDQMREYLVQSSAAMTRTAFDSECGGWYKTTDGDIVNNSPFSTIFYWWRTCWRGFSFSNYHIVF
jgi:cation diffusion facilitator CzcD-associated flavoprotein CzcO